MVGSAAVKQYALPQNPRAFVFDVDGTLYTNDAYVRHQIEGLEERYAREAGVPLDTAKEQIAAARAAHAARHGGTQTSLGNAVAELGYPISESVRWREELIEPERFLHPDPPLRDALSQLAGHARLVVLTNNPVSIGRRTLAALGVADLFTLVIGLDTTWHSKPESEPIAAAVAACEVPPDAVVSVGDRYEVDVAPALKFGCGGIVVEDVSEVFELPGLFYGSKR